MAVVLGAAVLMVGANRARADEPMVMNVTPVFGAFYTPDVWIPVTVDVRNPNDAPFQGVVRIPLRGPDGSTSDGPAVVEHDVFVPARSGVKSTSYIFLNEFEPQRGKDKNKVAPEVAVATLHTRSGQEVARVPLNLRSVNQSIGSDATIGGSVLTSIASPLESRGSSEYDLDELTGPLQYATGIGYQVKIMEPVEFQAGVTALASVPAVLLDVAPNDIDLAQRAALTDWVRAGGVLVVSAPAESSSAVGTWLEPLLPVNVIGRRVASDVVLGTPSGAWLVRETTRGTLGAALDVDNEDDDTPAPKKPPAPVKPARPDAQEKPAAKPDPKAKPAGPAKPPEKPAPVEHVPHMPRDMTSALAFRKPVEVVEAIEPLDATGVTVLAGDESYVHVASRQVGLGRVVFTSFPVAALDPDDARTGQLWKTIIGPARPGAVGATPAQPVSSTQLESNLPAVLSSMVGLSVPPWSVAAGVGGGYLLLVVVAQLALGGARRPSAFAVSVGGAVVLAGTLVALGQLRQRGQPFVSAGLSVVDLSPDGGGTRQDTTVLYGRDPGTVELTGGAGVQSVRPAGGSTQEVPVVRPQTSSVVLSPRSVSSESIGRLIRAEGSVPPSLKLSAVGSFGPDGLTVSIDNGTPAPLGSALVVWNRTSFSLPDLAQGVSMQSVGQANQNPRGSFTGTAVFTSERDRLRSDVMRRLGLPALTDTVSMSQPPVVPFLAAWGTDATVGPALSIQPPVDTTRVETLVRVPLQIKPTPAGSTVRVPAAFNKLVIGPTPVSIYNPSTGEWLSSNQDASYVVGFEAPKAIGKLKVTRATVFGDLNAARQKVTLLGGQVRNGKPTDNSAGRVLGAWSSPVTPQSVSFDVTPEDVDAQGRVWVRIDVQSPSSDGSPNAWRIVDLGVSFDDATVQ